MVRVISVHHFIGQHIETVEQPTACCVAAPNKLLLALTSNCVEVRDLKNESDVLFSFPTVDEVVQILYSRNGDFVATLETKFNRQNKEINFVRVYANWDSVATMQQSKMTNCGVSLGASECGMVQPMRARIAGRVTPTTNQSELGNLEMIEIPVIRNPHRITVDPISGNLGIVSGQYLNFYQFKVKTHDISKLKFIDFEQLPFEIELPFVPNLIEMAENYLGVMNENSLYMFRIDEKRNDHLEELNDNYNYDFRSHDETIDFAQLEKDEKLKPNLIKLTINLPTITRNNSIIHKNNPFTFTDKDMIAKISSITSPTSSASSSVQSSTTSTSSSSSVSAASSSSTQTTATGQTTITKTIEEQYEIKNFIQLKLLNVLIESPERQIKEEFRTIILKPIYLDKNLNRNPYNNQLVGSSAVGATGGAAVAAAQHFTNNVLKSDYRKDFAGLICMIATQQEGYLYYFNELESVEADHCITVYPFTAPVQNLVIEDYFLHALTETGLETYTLRYGHKLCDDFQMIDDVNVACPSVDDSICLVGLRPFLGVEKILLSDTNLILLANSDTSPTHSCSSNGSSQLSYWTLYNLELPNPRTIFNDISIVANIHRFTSVQTYRHLLSETHIILRLALILKRWTIQNDHVKLIQTAHNNNDDIIETYRTSCALLGDHYIMCVNENEYKLAIPYYKMARIQPAEVLKRVKKIQEQANNHITKGLIHYLKYVLYELHNTRDIDKFMCGGSKQNSIEYILDLIVCNNVEELPYLILKSAILREYSTDKLIDILSEKLMCESNERYLALCLLYIQKCNTEKSKEYLSKIQSDDLRNILKNNWELLFEITQNNNNNNNTTHKTKNMTFSELSIVLIGSYPDILAIILSELIIEKKHISLNKILRIFLEYLPSSIGSDSHMASLVLQKTFELYFQHNLAKIEDNSEICKIMYEKGSHEALKLLIRSYLSQLQILQLKEETKICNKSDEISSDIDTTDENQENDEKSSTQQPYFDDKQKKRRNSYIFASFRHEYLDKMPPFQIEITSKLYEASVVENYLNKNKEQQQQQIKKDKKENEADVILKKLQAILCNHHIINNNVIGEVETFLKLNENLHGAKSLYSIILNNNDAVLYLIENCPQCLLQFGKDRFSKTDEWKFLIATVQRRILYLNQNEKLNRVCFFHKKILKDILTHVATTMTLDQLVQVFPQRFSTTGTTVAATAAAAAAEATKPSSQTSTDEIYRDLNNFDNEMDILNEIQNYEPYVTICKDTMHANQINKLIRTTGQQLLATLNL